MIISCQPPIFSRSVATKLHLKDMILIKILQDLALDMMLEEPACVEVVLHPLLKTLEITQENLSSVLENCYNVENITFLTICFDLKRQGSLEPQLFRFIGSLKHLTALKLSSNCTDQLLAVLGLSCTQLKIFDAEADSEMAFTDKGLSFLCNCSQLQSIVLNDEGTEFDADERYPGVTGAGVANLIISLHNLNLLLIDPHLLKEAINFLYNVNFSSKSFPLKYLHLRFTNKDFIGMVKDLFPNLCSLRLEDPNKDILQGLSEMKSVENLTLSCYAWLSLNEIQLKASLENLKILTLRNPKILGIDMKLMKDIGNWCRELHTLTIAVYNNEGFVNTSHRISNKEIFFPKLKSLMFEGDVSIELIETFLSAIRDLEKISIYVHGFNFAPGVMDQLILQLVKCGNLAKLRYIQFYHWEVSLETLLYLIDQSIHLHTIWGLDLLTLSDESKTTIKDHIKKNNLNINIFDGLAPEPTFGLEFLDKRFSRQADRLYEYAHQLELENILIELNLL